MISTQIQLLIVLVVYVIHQEDQQAVLVLIQTVDLMVIVQIATALMIVDLVIMKIMSVLDYTVLLIQYSVQKLAVIFGMMIQLPIVLQVNVQHQDQGLVQEQMMIAVRMVIVQIVIPMMVVTMVIITTLFALE
jgi:hypothetical protein